MYLYLEASVKVHVYAVHNGWETIVKRKVRALQACFYLLVSFGICEVIGNYLPAALLVGLTIRPLRVVVEKSAAADWAFVAAIDTLLG